MGRHRRSVDKNPYDASSDIREIVEERLGLKDQVCTSCNARNPLGNGKCRKCGNTKLRRVSSDFRDE